jgi:hypothetical protein
MCPWEVWTFIDAKIPPRKFGAMSQEDVEALYQLNEELESSGEE